MQFTKLALLSVLFASGIAHAETRGAVFVMTNDPDPAVGNKVVMFRQANDGRLTVGGSYATGGLGSGPAPQFEGLQADGLNSQHSLIQSPDGRFLLASNARTSDISVFRIFTDHLELTDRIASGGSFPVSLVMRGKLLYVLNAGGLGNITGFTIDWRGVLTPVAGSTRGLAQTSPPPGDPPIQPFAGAQVSFTPAGNQLVVTVKEAFVGLGRILVYGVNQNGLPSASPVTHVGHGEVPFNFAFSRTGALLVTEVLGASPDPSNGSAVSSYRIGADGSLTTISASVPNGQSATCWIEINGSYAYTTNTLSHTLSQYAVGRDGSLTHVAEIPTNGVTLPLDLAFSPDGRFVYAVESGIGSVGAWRVDSDTGRLTAIGDVVAFEPAPAHAPSTHFSTDGGSPAGIVVVNFDY